MKYYSKARHKPGVMNGLESRYAAILEQRKMAGDIHNYFFEAVTLKLAADTRYTPDFMVINSNMEVEFHETKGFFREDAKIKVKVASAKFPFAFFVITHVKKQWVIENF